MEHPPVPESVLSDSPGRRLTVANALGAICRLAPFQLVSVRLSLRPHSFSGDHDHGGRPHADHSAKDAGPRTRRRAGLVAAKTERDAATLDVQSYQGQPSDENAVDSFRGPGSWPRTGKKSRVMHELDRGRQS